MSPERQSAARGVHCHLKITQVVSKVVAAYCFLSCLHKCMRSHEMKSNIKERNLTKLEHLERKRFKTLTLKICENSSSNGIKLLWHSNNVCRIMFMLLLQHLLLSLLLLFLTSLRLKKCFVTGLEKDIIC